MINIPSQLSPGKKLFFASDFHLGTPNREGSLLREKKIIRWLENIQPEAQAVFLLGDIFDFWFEYKHVIPKGFIRLLGKLADFTDQGIPVIFFTGNHDMWMFDFFPQELNVTIYREPQTMTINQKKFLIGHGDGLGNGDRTYKLMKKLFANPFCQWAFGWLHPNLGIALAQSWSRKSRINHQDLHSIDPPDDRLFAYCQDLEKEKHHSYYIFGHNHEPCSLEINPNSYYLNLGEWVNHFTYAVFDGTELQLEKFEG